MNTKDIKTISEVVKIGLCHSCGTCASVCPFSSIKISTENPFPKIEGKCTKCGLCVKVCPGLEINLPGFNKELFNSEKILPAGHFIKAFIAHSTNEHIRKNASSGGVITSLLLYALEKKLVTEALVVGQNKKQPWLSESYTAKTKQELLDSMQSKYQVAPLNQKLKSLNKAIVTALPCQVHGIRKYIKLNKGAKKKIYLTIGLYCHFNSTKECIDFILSKLKIQKKDIKKIDYRAGAWPGGLRVTLKNGHSRFIKKFSYHFTVPFFIPERCKTCIDLANDLADISVGDAWFSELLKKQSGWSILLARTKLGLDFINAAEKNKCIKLVEIKRNKVLSAHRHTIKSKKIGGTARVYVYKRIGRKTPNYYFKSKIRAIEIIKQTLFLLMLHILSKKATKKFVLLLPLNLSGAIARLARKITTFRNF